MGSAKALLHQVRKEQREIIILRQMIEAAELELLPPAIRYDKDKVQASASDPMLRMAESVEKYEKELKKALARIEPKRTKALRIVGELEDTTERQILYLYFLSYSRPSIDEVAEVVGYSRAQTYRIYKNALAKL